MSLENHTWINYLSFYDNKKFHLLLYESFRVADKKPRNLRGFLSINQKFINQIKPRILSNLFRKLNYFSSLIILKQAAIILGNAVHSSKPDNTFKK